MRARCGVVLLALVACEPPAPPADPPAPRWVYAPPPVAWTLGHAHGRIGRSQAPQPAIAGGITGDSKLAPLRLPTPWAVPGEGPARAVIYGTEVDHPAIELVDVDAGRLIWRDATSCTGPVVGVTERAVVCAVATGVRGIALDGKQGGGGWTQEGAYVAMTDDRIVLAGAGEAVVIDANDGGEVTRVKLPPGVGADTVIASCGDAGRELFATGQDGRLIRIIDGKGGPVVAWTLPMGAIVGIDACDGESVLVTTPGDIGPAIVAIGRATGKITGRVDGVRGSWPARDGANQLEVATTAGVAIWARDLASEPTAVALPVLGELIAKRGDRRLVRATPLTAALLDRSGVRAYLPFSEMGAVLGDQAIVGASWVGPAEMTVRRIGIPTKAPAGLRVPARHPGVAVPAELRDLPASRPVELASAITKPDTGMHAVAAVAVDPYDSAVVYAVALEHEPDDKTPTTIASAHLGKRAWTWQRTGGCGEGTPVGIAVAHEVVVCAARATRAGTVVATTRDGRPAWVSDWLGGTIDAIEAAGDTVVIHDADRAEVLDGATGRRRAMLASDDGAPVRAAIVEVDDTTLVITYEGGRVVGRIPRLGMIAAWSLAVDGVVRALSASRDGVLVELEDGDAVRIDARTAEITAMPGLGLVWTAAGELITGQTIGGPIPGIAQPPAPAPRPAFVRRLPPPPRDPEAPPMSTPVAPPAPLGESWQYTLYELTGGLRARNDYPLVGAVVATTVRGPAGSPLVVASGSGPREALVLDPRNGDPLRRVVLPEEAAPRGVFSTVVDGAPVAGTLLAAPLRVVLF